MRTEKSGDLTLSVTTGPKIDRERGLALAASPAALQPVQDCQFRRS